MSVWIADAERSREIDRRSTAEFGVGQRELMESAGGAVFDALAEILPDGGRLLVACGKGNNGGDGFVAARLALDHGYEVECLVAAKPGELRGEADEQRVLAQRAGIPCVFHGDPHWTQRLRSLGEFDLVVDALLGIGATGEVHGPVLEVIEAINESETPAIAVDVPSGIECDTGAELGDAVWALRTVTFGLAKPFLFQSVGLEKCGYWSVAEVLFPPQLLAEPTDARLLDATWVGERLPERLKGSHKGHNGAVLVVAGSTRMPGAAVLAARAALRSGAGYVGVASIPAVCDAIAAHVPEAVLVPLPESGGAIAEAAAAALLTEERWDSLVIGPGLSQDGQVASFLQALLPNWRTPLCVDGDALNAIALGCPLPTSPFVLTPHPGEMARLLGSDIATVQADRFGAARSAAQRLGGTVVLKGAHSVISTSGRPLLVNRTGNSGMAAAGMGDVLSGVVGTLLAQELSPEDAAACASYWHGLAGDLCAAETGPIGFLAGEAADALPKVRAKIVAACDTD
ncbi:MAG: NAD(P)H-hydrate dehydratase [Chthonomonadaceae bacterium]|nr:NAD(P)H-hydrate dehydratase [Chthonomonadaceae bacterium]